MKSKKLWGVCMNIYREMYRKAEPSADIDELMKSGVTTTPNWFMKFYLDQEKQTEIIERHIKGMSKLEKEKIRFEAYLGSSPNTSRKTWREVREKVMINPKELDTLWKGLRKSPMVSQCSTIPLFEKFMKSCHIGEARGDAQGETHVWSSEGVVSSLGGQTPPGRYSDRKHQLATLISVRLERQFL